MREGIAAFRPARVHTDVVEVEYPVEQAHVPVGGASRADVRQHFTRLARQMLRAECGHRTGAHVGDRCGVEQRDRHAGARIEKVEQRHLRRKIALVVVNVVADDLHASQVQRRDIAAQDIEVAVERGIGDEVHARLDHRLAAALREQTRFDRREDLVVGEPERLHVRAVQIVHENVH